MKMILRTLLTGLLLAAWTDFGYSGEPASLKNSVSIDVDNPTEAARWGRFDLYEYPASDVAPYTGNRKIMFANPLKFNFEELPEGKDCQIKASFLSDADRVMALDVNGTEFESRLVLSKGTPLTKTWTVPHSRLYNGRLSLTFSVVSGPNAVLQKLEILTEDGKELKPGKIEEFKEATDQELNELVMSLPEIAPRPSVVAGIKDPIMTLNGTWSFSPDGSTDFKPIRVPGEWAMQGFTVPDNVFAVYKRTFKVPSDWKGHPVKLRFDAVHAVCEVIVNGDKVGSHQGGFVPFEMDITKSLIQGKDNTIEVRVQSQSIPDSVSCISQYAAHQVGGIIRKVTLFAVPSTYIASDKSHTSLNSNYKNAVLHYDILIRKPSGGEEKIKVNAALKDTEGRVVASQSKNTNISESEEVPLSFELSVNDANLWTPETPTLYSLVCSIESNGRPLGSIERKIGLRQIEVKGNRLFVNGNPVKLLAVNRHEVHPLKGRSLTPELCREDAKLYKACNNNTIRTSHYPPSEEFLDACDEIGLFVECEAAACWVQHGASPVWKRWNYRSPVYFPYLLRPTLDQMAAYRNHTCIVMWSLANESVWSYLWDKVLKVAKTHEQSRPILFHDQCWGGYNNAGSTAADIANYHYPSENNPEQWSNAGRPVWFGEYAHLQCYNRRELYTDPGIQEDWSRPLQRMVDLMWDQPGCLGGAIWSGIDDVFHMPDGNLCGYGHWGPIDGWRREKPEYHGVRMAYTPLRVFSTIAEEGKPLVLSVQNRQNFLNLNQNTITWKSGNKTGIVKADLPPHAKGTITIDESFNKGESVIISVKSPNGHEIAREVLFIRGDGGEPNPSLPLNKLVPISVEPDGMALLDKINGKLPLPIPMVLPISNDGGKQGPAGSILSNEIEAFTPINDWTWTRTRTTGEKILYTGNGEDGNGDMELTPQKDGSILIRYRITVNKEINPRQWGVVFTLPRSYDTITWDRKAHWSWYPDDQIGRPKGKIKANPDNRPFVEEPGVEPKNQWKDNSNHLGSNDFRSTKMNIRYALISDKMGNSYVFTPYAGNPEISQSVRAWVRKDHIHVLVAGFNTGGADHFFATHYSSERKPLKKGDTIESTFVIAAGNIH